MTTKTKKIVLSLLAFLLFLVVIYFEGNGFEIHRFLIAFIAVIESILVSKTLDRLDRSSKEKQLSSSKKTLLTILVCTGLILSLLAVDQLVNYVTSYYNKEYSITWTIIIPGSVLAGYVFGILDAWSLKREKKQNL